MELSKAYKSYNCGNEILIYIIIFIKKEANEGKSSKGFLVLAVYNY